MKVRPVRLPPAEPNSPPRKVVTVKLTLEPIEGEYDSDDLIAADLEQEISCCWHSFDVLSIEIQDEKGENDGL